MPDDSVHVLQPHPAFPQGPSDVRHGVLREPAPFVQDQHHIPQQAVLSLSAGHTAMPTGISTGETEAFAANVYSKVTAMVYSKLQLMFPVKLLLML